MDRQWLTPLRGSRFAKFTVCNSHRGVGLANGRRAPLRQDALGRRGGEVERRLVGLGHRGAERAIVEPGGQLVVVVVEHPAAAAASDDPEGLRESEQAVESVRATPEDEVLL